MQHLTTSREEQTVAVVRDHEGGTRLMLAPSTRRHDDGDIGGSGVDSSDENGGGVIFDNPKRGSLTRERQAAWTGKRRERRRGRSGGSLIAHLPMCDLPEHVVLEGPCTRRESGRRHKTRKGCGKPTSHEHASGISPRAAPTPQGVGRRAGERGRKTRRLARSGATVFGRGGSRCRW